MFYLAFARIKRVDSDIAETKGIQAFITEALKSQTDSLRAEMASKTDMKNFATKLDLKDMATKLDLSKLASKKRNAICIWKS